MSNVVKEALYRDRREVLPLTEELVGKVARFNGMMTPERVRAALLAGHTIYTNFDKYRLEGRS